MPARVLVVDNYDSFVYNLVQYLGQLGAEPIVRRNDALELDEVEELGLCGDLDLARARAARRRRHQRASDQGRSPVSSPSSGFASAIRPSAMPSGPAWCERPNCCTARRHRSLTTVAGIFDGLPSAPYGNPVPLARRRTRHSGRTTLEVSAWAEDGTVMGIRHKALPVDGVQFHPEAVLTAGGHRLLANWLASCGLGAGVWRPCRPPPWPPATGGGRLAAVPAHGLQARTARRPEPELVRLAVGRGARPPGQPGSGDRRAGHGRDRRRGRRRGGGWRRSRGGGGGSRRRSSPGRWSWSPRVVVVAAVVVVVAA